MATPKDTDTGKLNFTIEGMGQALVEGLFNDTKKAEDKKVYLTASDKSTLDAFGERLRQKLQKTLPKTVLTEAEDVVSGARQREYGPPHENFQRIADIWGALLGISLTPEKVVLCMIGLKLARGAHSVERDTMVDIAGYSRVMEELKKDAGKSKRTLFGEGGVFPDFDSDGKKRTVYDKECRGSFARGGLVLGVKDLDPDQRKMWLSGLDEAMAKHPGLYDNVGQPTNLGTLSPEKAEAINRESQLRLTARQEQERGRTERVDASKNSPRPGLWIGATLAGHPILLIDTPDDPHLVTNTPVCPVDFKRDDTRPGWWRSPVSIDFVKKIKEGWPAKAEETSPGEIQITVTNPDAGKILFCEEEDGDEG